MNKNNGEEKTQFLAKNVKKCLSVISEFFKVLFKNINLSTLELDRLALFLHTIFPAVLKMRLLGTS